MIGEINSDEGLVVKQHAGVNAFRDVVPALEVSISEMHTVGITDVGLKLRSTMLVSPLRLADGTLRPTIDPEPAFHPDAHYLVRITGRSMRNDVYHQFDEDGNYLG